MNLRTYRMAVPIWFLTIPIVASPQSALAFELFGICFAGKCDNTSISDADIIDPKTYNMTFMVPDNSDKDLLEPALKAGSELWRGKEKAVAGSAGLISRAKGDYRRLLASLYNQGYYGGDISIRIDDDEAAELPPGFTVPENSDVVISIETGPIYRFGQFEIFNQAPLPQLDEDVVKTPDDLKVLSGEIARADLVKRAARLEIAKWRELGYANARLMDQSVKARHDENVLNVSLTIDPGEKIFIGATEVEGSERVDAGFIAYMAALEQGQEFDPDDIEGAEQRLNDLGVFSVRKVTIEEDGAVKIKVQEKKPRRIGFGATVSSVDGAGLSSFWQHRNLFGKAESLRFEGEVSGIGSHFALDELDFSLSTTFIKPGVFTPQTNWITTASATREFNTTFEGESGNISSKLSHQLTNRASFAAGGFYEYSRFKDAFGTREFSLVGLEGEAIYDARDDRFDPTKGFFAKLAARPFYEFQFDNFGLKLDSEVRAFASLGSEEQTTLAGRFRLGSISGPARSEVPTNYLYFAGGGGSVRGFETNNIGVTDTSGTVSGGRSLLETSFEIRHRLNETIGLVAFTDAGIVGEDPWIDFSQDVRVSAGLGVRYYTSLGPIRLDVGVPINPQKDDPDFGIFAGIGQAF